MTFLIRWIDRRMLYFNSCNIHQTMPYRAFLKKFMQNRICSLELERFAKLHLSKESLKL